MAISLVTFEYKLTSKDQMSVIEILLLIGYSDCNLRNKPPKRVSNGH
jgi:hypothetical protein